MTEQLEVQLTEEEVEAQLPRPVGYMILVALPKVEEAYDSGIIKADRTRHEEYILSSMGAVIDMGEEAYADKERYPNGPWCKVGDFVMFRPNTGTRFKVNGAEYRLMNDDSVQAVVADPRGIVRA
jgi:co-chaperonin GroES (HSP10)